MQSKHPFHKPVMYSLGIHLGLLVRRVSGACGCVRTAEAAHSPSVTPLQSLTLNLPLHRSSDTAIEFKCSMVHAICTTDSASPLCSSCASSIQTSEIEITSARAIIPVPFGSIGTAFEWKYTGYKPLSLQFAVFASAVATVRGRSIRGLAFHHRVNVPPTEYLGFSSMLWLTVDAWILSCMNLHRDLQRHMWSYADRPASTEFCSWGARGLGPGWSFCRPLC